MQSKRTRSDDRSYRTVLTDIRVYLFSFFPFISEGTENFQFRPPKSTEEIQFVSENLHQILLSDHFFFFK